jgi:FtsH-binding integral membrane protein
MKVSIYKLITYALILIGAMSAIYANANEAQNIYLLIGGIFALLFGLMRLSKTIPSKSINDDEMPQL